MSGHSMLQLLSAASMTWEARWYAESAAAGMPLAVEPAMNLPAEPFGTPGAIWPGWLRLAGALMARSGMVVPSGSLPLPPCGASALAVLVSVRLVVHAPDRS